MECIIKAPLGHVRHCVVRVLYEYGGQMMKWLLSFFFRSLNILKTGCMYQFDGGDTGHLDQLKNVRKVLQLSIIRFWPMPQNQELFNLIFSVAPLSTKLLSNLTHRPSPPVVHMPTHTQFKWKIIIIISCPQIYH